MIDPNEAADRMRKRLKNSAWSPDLAEWITSVLDDRDRLLAAEAAVVNRSTSVDRVVAALYEAQVKLAARLDAIEGDWSTRNTVAELDGWRDVAVRMQEQTDARLTLLEALHRRALGLVEPVVSRERLSWDGGTLINQSGVRRGFASKSGEWRADTADLPGPWTIVALAPSFTAACDAMAAHLRSHGFDVPPRPERS